MKKNKNKIKIKLKGALKGYLSWPLYLTALLLCMTLSIYVVSKNAAAVMLLFTAIYFLISMILFVFKRPYVMGELVRFAADYGQLQHSFLKELDIPYGVLDTEGHLLWANNELKDIIMYEKTARGSIQEIFPDFSLDALPTPEEDVSIDIVQGKNIYRVQLRLLDMSDFYSDMPWSAELVDEQNNVNCLMAAYFYDETEIRALRKENEEEKMAVGLLYIDNYDDALAGADEARRSLITAWVEREISKPMIRNDAILKRLEKDKYIFFIKQRGLSKLVDDRFSILEEIRNLNIYDTSVTISIGIGAGAPNYLSNYALAQEAMDHVLSRGGDQAVVNTNGVMGEVFGGKGRSKERTSRVKARVKAVELQNHITTSKQILIMGHSNADSDSIGAAVGIYCIAKALENEAYKNEVHIVLNQVTDAIRPLVEQFHANPQCTYPEDMFISGSKAQSLVSNDTLLIVVDTSNPKQAECPELLEKSKNIVVIDHHRQGKFKIENPVMDYIESSASSVCEMITEMFPHINGALKLKKPEADAMYSGIMIDTNNFQSRAGVRTFEAASYLQRSGADITRVRKMFRVDFKEYQAKMKAVASAELFMEWFMFTEVGTEDADEPDVFAAKVANELLGITNVRASFVAVCLPDGRIKVSARSINELNVQKVLEKIGGGGHMSEAAVYLSDCTTAEAMEKVKDVLRDMIEKGDIK